MSPVGAGAAEGGFEKAGFLRGPAPGVEPAGRAGSFLSEALAEPVAGGPDFAGRGGLDWVLTGSGFTGAGRGFAGSGGLGGSGSGAGFGDEGSNFGEAFREAGWTSDF